jgi:hypothetical protein
MAKPVCSSTLVYLSPATKAAMVVVSPFGRWSVIGRPSIT